MNRLYMSASKYESYRTYSKEEYYAIYDLFTSLSIVEGYWNIQSSEELGVEWVLNQLYTSKHKIPSTHVIFPIFGRSLAYALRNLSDYSPVEYYE